MILRWGAVPAALLLLVTPVFADGLIPPRPYHYLHPPSAFKRSNHKPSGGERLIPVSHGRSSLDFTHFTTDGQAGLGAHIRTFAVDSRAKFVDLKISPVDLPAPLPHKYSIDGNAYRITATAKPGGAEAKVTTPVGVVFRWPLLPHALLVYSGKQWKPVCDANGRGWQISSLVVLCRASVLGTFVLVRRVYK